MEINDVKFEKIIQDIDRSVPQVIPVKSEKETFKLWYDPVLLSDLSGNLGAFLVRAMLNKLNIDEHHVLSWGLENKYHQYKILNHYVPDCMMETIALSQLLSEKNGDQKIRELCRNGFFIKATLGDGTGRANSFDRTDELDDILNFYQKEERQEKWVLQKRLNFVEEFRIHTFGRELIPGLTFIIKGFYSSDGFDAEVFVKRILDQLPDTILQGTLIGWDIGITDTQEFYVIETNITGFHPEIKRGFQTSGYFGDRHYRSIVCGWLNNYFRNKYHISIGSVETELISSDSFYGEFLFYSSIFDNKHLKILENRTKDTSISAILYFGEDINVLLVNLVGYLQLTNCAQKYYLIICKKHLLKMQDIFKDDDTVHILTEDSLFTKDQYPLIKVMDYDRRKKSCFHQVIHIIKDKPYLLI